MRLTAPPADPLQPVPVVRGAIPGTSQQGKTFGGVPTTKPGYLPDYIPTNTSKAQPAAQQAVPPRAPAAPLYQQQYAPIPVQLGTPELQPVPQVLPPTTSPVGYPNVGCR